MYHAIVIDKQFKDEKYLDSLKIFAEKRAGSWRIFGIEVEDSDLEKLIKDIQENIRPNEPWYAHAYNDEELIVIFKEKVFRVKPHISTWGPVFEYGRTLEISEDQLNFWPNRFQDEQNYFTN